MCSREAKSVIQNGLALIESPDRLRASGGGGGGSHERDPNVPPAASAAAI